MIIDLSLLPHYLFNFIKVSLLVPRKKFWAWGDSTPPSRQIRMSPYASSRVTIMELVELPLIQLVDTIVSAENHLHIYIWLRNLAASKGSHQAETSQALTSYSPCKWVVDSLKGLTSHGNISVIWRVVTSPRKLLFPATKKSRMFALRTVQTSGIRSLLRKIQVVRNQKRKPSSLTLRDPRTRISSPRLGEDPTSRTTKRAMGWRGMTFFLDFPSSIAAPGFRILCSRLWWNFQHYKLFPVSHHLISIYFVIFHLIM